jgi:hypothetical protein
VGSIPACVGENTTLIRIVNSRATKALAQRWAIVNERAIKHVGSARTSRVGLAGVCVCLCVCVCACVVVVMAGVGVVVVVDPKRWTMRWGAVCGRNDDKRW